MQLCLENYVAVPPKLNYVLDTILCYLLIVGMCIIVVFGFQKVIHASFKTVNIVI